MAMPSSIPAVMGVLAGFSTSALVAVHAIMAHELASPASSSTRTIALVSSALEGTVLIVLSTHLFLCIRRSSGASFMSEKQISQQQAQQQRRSSRYGIWFGLAILFCTTAAAASVAALISLGKSVHNLSDTIFGSNVVPFLAGASVTLGICYAAQLLFLVVYFIVARFSALNTSHIQQPTSLETGGIDGSDNVVAGRNNDNGSNMNRSPPSSMRVKSIPYSQTSSPANDWREKKALSIISRSKRDSAYAETVHHTPPSSSGGRSAFNTMQSLRTSFSQVIRPISSRTRLISTSKSGEASGTSSQRSSAWRPISLAGSSSSPVSTYASREHDVRPSVEDFDSWDTSAVDPQTRQTVLESSATPSGIAGRFLETIPASPTTSRSPSPGTPLDLEPPRSHRRGRSYSPSASMRSESSTRMRSQSHSQSPPPNEAHIHPLFRSNSPTPPPAVSAGTVVTAAPNGGRTLASDAHSLRALNRMRSGSLPAVPSPLSRQGSFDDFGMRRGMTVAERPRTGGGNELREDGADVTPNAHDGDDSEVRREQDDDSAGRKMTPPIPDWILSAGSRTSLSGYQSRKVRIQDGTS